MNRIAAAALAAALIGICGQTATSQDDNAAPGSLTRLGPDGQPAGLCPLKHTDVKAEITGFLARVNVTQEFGNSSQEKIEAVYTFPLPQNAAVDDMTLIVGDRIVRGKIKRREEARAIYDAARAAGQVAGLLDQERPNIFTQHVANIMPGESVKITISYVETLQYEAGSYEFVFPMVVGPRYIPGRPIGRQGGGWSPDTTRVPDASRITPPVAKPGTRAGHDISVEVNLDAGLPVNELTCPTHAVDVQRAGPSRATVRLRDAAAIPNKDFILNYDVAGARIADAVLTHRTASGGFFTLILQPPDHISIPDVAPKELVFVLDTSGSMSGAPIEKAKETMRLALASLNPRDTFNLITFSGDTRILFPAPVPATSENLRAAHEFLSSRTGSGGTEMMRAIRAALAPSDHQGHIRIVCFMTDGYVGNDMAIIGEIQQHPNARVFSFGIGSSVNRFLLDKMAEAGRGEVQYVGLNDDGSAAAEKFYERVRNPLLTDISVDWGGLAVTDVYPARIPDVFSAKPVILKGRYDRPGRATIRLQGQAGGRTVTREIAVNLPALDTRHDVLATLWARARVDDLMAQDWAGAQTGNPRPDVREAVTGLGLQFKLMTQFTSFVAVEEMSVTTGGVPRRIEVPVDMPEGVSYEGVFGSDQRLRVGGNMPAAAGNAISMSAGVGVVGGIAGGMPRGQALFLRASDAESRDDRATPVKIDPSLRGKTGKLEVRIYLSEVSAAVLEQLKKLGFEIVLQPKTAKMVIGRIGADKLAELEKLTAVIYVERVPPFPPYVADR
jgi:Ca-activated chloride channel family protein